VARGVTYRWGLVSRNRESAECCKDCDAEELVKLMKCRESELSGRNSSTARRWCAEMDDEDDDDGGEAQLSRIVSKVRGSGDEETYKMMSSDEPPTGYPLAQPSAKHGGPPPAANMPVSV